MTQNPLDLFDARTIEIGITSIHDRRKVPAFCYNDLAAVNVLPSLRHYNAETVHAIEHYIGPECWVIFHLNNGAMWPGIPAFKSLDDIAPAILEISTLTNSWARATSEDFHRTKNSWVSILRAHGAFPLTTLTRSDNNAIAPQGALVMNGYEKELD